MPRTYHPILEILKKIKRSLSRLAPLFLIVIFITLATAAMYFNWPVLSQKFAKVGKQPEAVINEPVISARFTRALDGVEVDSTEQKHPLNISIMVENNVEAWPLTGLSHASIVYEVLSEGRIPRFLLILPYGEKFEKIGPVRSARTYYLELQKAFNALYLHVGGSPDALSKLKEFGIRDYDQFFFDDYFWRDKVRYAPHNVYTSSDLMTELVTDFEIPVVGQLNGWIYKDAKKFTEDEAKNYVKKDIVVNYTTGTYQAKYIFLPEKGQYQRYQAKDPLKMMDGTEIFADNVIIEEHKHQVYDVVGRRNIEIVGDGKAWVFRDGEVVEATWKKPVREEMTRYYDIDGKEIELNRGKTWINIVEPGLFKYEVESQSQPQK